MGIVASRIQHVAPKTDGMLGERGRTRQTDETVSETQQGETGQGETGDEVDQGGHVVDQGGHAAPPTPTEALREMAGDLLEADGAAGAKRWAKARRLLRAAGFEQEQIDAIAQGRDVEALLKAVEKIEAAGQ